MNRLTSSLLAGLMSAVMWTVISLYVGDIDHSTVWTWAVIFFVGVTAVTFLISTMIRGSAARR